MLSKDDHLLPANNGRLTSISGTIGFGPWFISGGLDIVVSNDEVGVFSVSSIGPGVSTIIESLGFDNPFPTSNDEEWSFVSPQFGPSMKGGSVYGNSIKEIVASYGGTSLVVGGSIGAGSFDAFSSVDPTTGLANWNVVGYASGGGMGVNPLEGHVYYAQAIYQNRMSGFLTNVGQWLGLLDK